MSKTKNTPVEVQPKAGPGFQPGHAKFGGRKRANAQRAWEIAQELNVDPLRHLLLLLKTDEMDDVETGPDGKARRVRVPVPQDLKVDICKTLLNYLHPRLTATELTGANEGPIEVASLDINVLLADPSTLQLAQALSLALSTRETAPQPGPKLLPAPDLAPEDVLEKDHRGHYKY